MLGGMDLRTIAVAVRRAFNATLGSVGSVVLADPTQASGFQSVPVAFNWKNRLINPDGRIYVRAAVATADDTYFANSWYILSQTNTVTPSVLTDPEDGYPAGVRITQSQAVAQRFGFAQIIEGRYCKDLRGKSGVMVPRIRCSSAQAIRYAILGWTGTEDAVTSDVVLDWTSASYAAGGFFLAANLQVLSVGSQLPTVNTWASLAAITAALGSTFNNIVVMVWTEGTAAQNVTLDFDYVQFERGSVATEFERRTHTIEELLTQRYLPSFVVGDVDESVIGQGGCVNTSAAHVFLPFRAEARTPPTGVTVSNVAHFNLYSGIAGATAATAISISGNFAPSKSGAGLVVTGTGTPYTARDPASFVGEGIGVGRYIYFTGAEL